MDDPVDLTNLVGELRRIVGEDWVYTSEHELRTYESDGLLQYHVIPAAAVLPGSAIRAGSVARFCGGADRGLCGAGLPSRAPFVGPTKKAPPLPRER